MVNHSPLPAPGKGKQPLVVAEDLHVHLAARHGLRARGASKVRAVDGVSLSIDEGETLGLVGESGCGKSTLGLTLLRLITPTSGKVVFAGQDITRDPPRRLKPVRRAMQLIFQDPIGSLNPRQRVDEIVRAGLDIQGIGTASERRWSVLKALESVGLGGEIAHRYPHELSGGQRQRVGIARALVMRPRFIVADEPVSSLDVSVQSQVLNLLVDLRDEFNLTYLFISHNFAAVEYMSDRIAVMYLGKIVEVAPAEAVCNQPLHPYTSILLAAVPHLNARDRPEIADLGEVPSAVNPPSGCRFRTRCPMAERLCAEIEPPLERSGEDDHWVACHFAGHRSNIGPIAPHGEVSVPLRGEHAGLPTLERDSRLGAPRHATLRGWHARWPNG